MSNNTNFHNATKKIVGFHGKALSGKGTASDLVMKIRDEHENLSTVISFAEPMKEILATHLNIPLEAFYDQTKKKMLVKDLIKESSPYNKSAVVGLVYPEGAFKSIGAERMSVYRQQLKSVPLSYVDWFNGFIYDISCENRVLMSYPKLNELYEGITLRQLMQHFATEVVRELFPDYWVMLLAKRVEHSDASLILIDDIRFQNELELCLSLEDKFPTKLFRIDREVEAVGDAHSSETVLVHEAMKVIDNNKDIPHLEEQLRCHLMQTPA